MSRVVATALSACLILACAGRGSRNDPPVQGTHDIMIAGADLDLLFITSADQDVLRVIDLDLTGPNNIDPESTIPEFIRAPNPLEPLSIPVISQPVGLIRDERIQGSDIQGGHYVYAHSAVTPAISVVGAGRELLREVLRLPTSGPVTALAALAGEQSTLYYATYEEVGEGSEARLFRVTLPAPDQLEGFTPTAAQILSLPGASISSVALLPQGSLAIAIRDRTHPQGGRSFLVDATGAELRELQFPAPVRRLQTNPAVVIDEVEVLAAGARIFGVLDEESCGGAATCRGILAVDTVDGTLSRHPGTADPMLPLGFGAGVIGDFALGRRLDLEVPGIEEATGLWPLVGMVTSSTGLLYFFDAYELRPFDADALAGRLVAAPAYQGPDGTLRPYLGGPNPQSVTLAEGAARNEVVRVIYQGFLPGVAGPIETPSSQVFTLPAAAPALGDLQVGDRIILLDDEGECGEVGVSAVDFGAGEVSTSESIPAACADATRYVTRAAGVARPYVVRGDATGYMGRTGPGDLFSYPRGCSPSSPCPEVYTARPHGYQPTAPALAFTFTQSPPDIERGATFSLPVASGFTPLYIGFDGSYYGRVLSLPSAVIHRPQTTEIFVSFPYGDPLGFRQDTVVFFRSGTVAPLQANSRNLVVLPSQGR